MIRLNIYVMMLFLTKSFSQNQNNISYDRIHYNNKKIITSTEDHFRVEFGLNKSLNVFGNFSNQQIILDDKPFNYNSNKITNLYSFDIGFKKEIAFKSDWKANITLNPQIRTNDFDQINKDNFIPNTTINFNKKFKNDSDLAFGVEYGTLFGKPKLYPIFQYNKAISSKFSYSIGFPKSSLKYNANEKNNFKIVGNYNGYYSEIDSNMSVNKSFFLSKIETSLQYNYIFYNESIVTINIGKSFENRLKIENNNVNTNHQFNNDCIISMGFKYNLNFK
jgi:Domain of unknown function (DUF6268)